jgi:hypothetical protein
LAGFRMGAIGSSVAADSFAYFFYMVFLSGVMRKMGVFSWFSVDRPW